MSEDGGMSAERPTTVEARRSAAAELGEAMRAALDALVLTEVPNEKLEEAARLARSIEHLLAAASRPVNQLAATDDFTDVIKFYNPVTGLGNPMSPPLRYVELGDRVVARVTMDARFEGPPGLVHGGVSAMLLDEVFGKTGAEAGRWGMTAYLNVSYHGAVPLQRELELVGRVQSFERRKTIIAGTIALASDPDAVLVSAEGLFIRPSAEASARNFGTIVDASGATVEVGYGEGMA